MHCPPLCSDLSRFAGPCRGGRSPPVRVAVVSNGNDKDLAALVTSKLSFNPAVSIIERDDLAKIGDEAKWQHIPMTKGAPISPTSWTALRRRGLRDKWSIPERRFILPTASSLRDKGRLVPRAFNVGFRFLPFADIDAY